MTHTSTDRPTLPVLETMKRVGGEADADLLPLVESANIESEGVAKPKISSPERFKTRDGFNSEHLRDFFVEWPTPDGVRARDIVPIAGDPSGRLDYMHFSAVLSGSRRMAMFTAVNIEGKRSVSIPREGDKWFLDGRAPIEFQCGEELYTGNRLDRGHLVRREDPNWGADADVANADTFHFTNCAPQMDNVNQKTWLGLENYILQNARAWKERCSVFTGPVFGRNDIKYRGVRIPKAFWKVVAFISDDNEPSATAYVVSQKEELQDLEAAFGAYKTYQRSVRSIEELTGLRFGDLADYDGFSNTERTEGVSVSSEVRVLGDIRLPAKTLRKP